MKKEKIRTNPMRRKYIEQDEVKMEIGIMDANAPRIVYMVLNTFILPRYDDEIDSEKIRSGIQSELKRRAKKILKENPSFDDRLLVHVDLPSTRIGQGRSFLSTEVYISQSGEMRPWRKALQEALPIASGVADEIQDILDEIEFSASKNRR